MIDERPFWTIQQVADVLQTSDSEVRALVRANKIPALRIPGTGRRRMIRIRREDLVAFLETAAVETADRARPALRVVGEALK